MTLRSGPGFGAIAAYLATASLQPPAALTASAPMTLTQTWNNVGVTFTAFKIAITDSNSAAASLLMDLQVASSSVFKIQKNGSLTLTAAAGGGTVDLLVGGSAWPRITRNGVEGAMVLTSNTGGLPIYIDASDLAIARDAANTLAQKNGNADQTQRWYSSNAAYAQIQSLSESHTLALAATSDTTITFPANSIGLGVTVRVTTLITGCTTFDVGIAGATTRYGTGIALTANTTNTGVGLTNPSIYAAATKVRFSAVGGGASFTAGVVRVTMHYISLSAATS